MTNLLQDAERQDRLKAMADRSFEKWLSEPMTRMGLSMIPAGEQQDTLKLLLRSAFDAGNGNGQGSFAIEMLEALVKKDKGNLFDGR